MPRTNRNLSTTLPRRRCARDPMQRFDALPPELRAWVAQAALPWSAGSCLRIWRKSRAQGASTAQTLERLSAIEAGMLARDRHSGAQIET